jgi:hypothetical protein
MSSTTTAIGTTSTIHRIARAWSTFVAWIAALVFAGIIDILLGLNTLPKSIPLVELVQSNAVGAVGFCLAFVTITVVAFFVLRANDNSQPSHQNDPASPLRWLRIVLPTIISTTSFALFAALLATVLLRPSWCPPALCPAPSIVYAPNSIHDNNLEMYLTDLQTGYYAIPGNPSQYNATNAPHSIGVVRVDKAAAQSYRVIFTLHSVRRSGYDIIIEQIAVHIQDVPITPQPLNVWNRGSPQYLNYPFVANYAGQAPGVTVPATFDTPVPSILELASGEADTVGLQIAATSRADVRFSISVQYRIANEATISPPVTLPGTFEVIFTDGSNWHQYTLDGNRFTPSP